MDPEAYVADHMALFRAGQEETAFFGLLEFPGLLPILTRVFRSETDADVRAFLVKVLWEHRDPVVLPVLGEALGDRKADVWKEALNGLVVLASPESLGILNRALCEPVPGRVEQAKFDSWVSEAIEQAKEAIQQDQHAV